MHPKKQFMRYNRQKQETYTMKNRVGMRITIRLLTFLLVFLFFALNISFAQLEKNQNISFIKIQRIVVKSDSVISFYSIDSISITKMNDFFDKSTIDSIIDKLKLKSNTLKLNKDLYLIYLFFLDSKECLHTFSNAPVFNLDNFFVFNSMLYDGKKEDETFYLDFWKKNINKDDTKTIYKIYNFNPNLPHPAHKRKIEKTP